MPFYQFEFVKVQRYTTGADAPNLEVAELKAEQLIPEIEDSDWGQEDVDYVVFEYKGPNTEEEEK